MWRSTWNGERSELIDDCEAVLAGRYVEQLQRFGGPVPDWAWTNALSHASESRLRAITTEKNHRRERSGLPWQQARAYLSADHAAARVGSLEELQQRVLVPLELELMTDRRSGHRPSEWVVRVIAAISKSRQPHLPAPDDSL